MENQLDRFIAASGDERLAMALEELRDAYDEAGPAWRVVILEFIHAVETGKGLNRPL